MLEKLHHAFSTKGSNSYHLEMILDQAPLNLEKKYFAIWADMVVLNHKFLRTIEINQLMKCLV